MKNRCIICEKEIIVAHGHNGICCCNKCADAYEKEEGFEKLNEDGYDV